MRILILFLAFAVGFGGTCFAQEKAKPEHRIAIRLNTLGLLNLDLIGDVEYAISQRIGVFVGGGSEYFQPSFMPARYWFKKDSEEYCKHTNWGVYAGARISIPIWKFTGLALRPYLFYQLIDMQGSCWSVPTVGPGISSIKGTELGMAVNLAYTQVFAKRFFVEPAIGFGPEILTRDIVPYGHGRHITFVMPVQLNLGVRF